MKLLRNSTFFKGIIVFLCFVMIQSGFELHALEADHNEELNELVKKYNNEEYDEIIVKLDLLLSEVGEDQAKLRGKFFLLLGAAHEKKGNKDKAVENYLLGDILLGNLELEGVDLKSLKIFNNTIYGKVINGKRVFEKVGKRKRKKKFPYLAILGVATLVAAVLLFSKKNKSGENEELNMINAKNAFSKIEWVEIPAGEFIMGDSTGKGSYDETPAHAVYLDSYKISKYEITYEQFQEFIHIQPSYETSQDVNWQKHPVTNVTHNNASDYCLWLNRYTNKSVFLPTEAQWEKAARGTDQRIYPWGNNIPDCSITNYNNCISKTSIVGSYPDDRSYYGVIDMGGNVKEFVKDAYSSTYYSSSPYTNPEGPDNGYSRNRVIRGGGFNSSDLRVTNRDFMSNYYTRTYVGFRIVWIN